MEQPGGTDWDELAKATARNLEEPEMTPPDAELLSVPETDEDLKKPFASLTLLCNGEYYPLVVTREGR
ncbi:MAG: hypothetical protein MUQ25_04240 [Candidatus Aminicenantes bacterium]|nr:hypothetical protein [Candidatus Aminicenantes bacterium]